MDPTLRVDRLVGGGKVEGGGLPLPSLFNTILDQLQLYQEQTLDELRAPVEKELSFKESRLQRIYGSDDMWQSFITDGLEQLRYREIITSNGDGKWSLGSAFKTHEPMVVIPARKDKNDKVSITVFPPNEWEERDLAAKHKMAITEAVTKLRRHNAGLRPIDEKHVAALTESMRQFGWKAEFPVLVDQEDRILDGRHRLAAAEAAGVQHTENKITTTSDAEALAIAWLANESKGWSNTDRERIAKLLTADNVSHGGVAQVLYARRMPVRVSAEIEARLRTSSKDVRTIAKATGSSFRTVRSIKEKLEASGEVLPERNRGKKTAKIREIQREHPDWGSSHVAREVGCSDRLVRKTATTPEVSDNVTLVPVTRKPQSVGWPVPLHAWLEARAVEEGISFSEYVVDLVTEAAKARGYWGE